MSSTHKGIIRVLIVDDSLSMCKVLTDILNSDPELLVVGVAYNGKDAIEIVPKLDPDIITMDLHMPLIDGFEATKQIMAYNPKPILVVAASILGKGMAKVFETISYGALDVIDKNQIELAAQGRTPGENLIDKIKFLSRVKVIRHPLAKLEDKHSARVRSYTKSKNLRKIVAIAASTGGPHALLKILKELPASFPCGILVVQHIAGGFTEGLVDWLGNQCEISIKVAENLEEIKPGVVYFGPNELQMGVEQNGRIVLTNEPPRNGQRPSGDVLFESVAEIYGENVIGVVLTGMGKDGADGAKVIKKEQGATIAQDEESCVVFGMPKEAIELGAVDTVLPLDKIADKILSLLDT